MQNHIFRPIPSLGSLPEPANKEERLKIIIANLEKHNETVRSSILEEARMKLHSLHDEAAYSSEMDVDSIEHPDNTLLIANLNAPYVETSGDPCAKAGSPLPPPDPYIRQVPVPPVLAMAQEAIQQLEAYDKHAKETRDYYVTALERMRGARSETAMQGEGIRDPRRRPTT
ncbi:hypothetical protein LTR85_001280 [Meristemomyces frigidus]|nr:hypothetical protein LTR85_001280 [Meristemomyces frigidus]